MDLFPKILDFFLLIYLVLSVLWRNSSFCLWLHDDKTKDWQECCCCKFSGKSQISVIDFYVWLNIITQQLMIRCLILAMTSWTNLCNRSLKTKTVVELASGKNNVGGFLYCGNVSTPGYADCRLLEASIKKSRRSPRFLTQNQTFLYILFCIS